MFKGNMNFQTKEPRRMLFDLTQGMDTMNSPIGNLKLQLAQDVDFTDRGFKPAPTSTALGTGSGTIYGIGVVKDDTGDTYYRFSGSNLEKYNGSTWGLIQSGFTRADWNMVSVEGPKLFISLLTGTFASGTTRSAVTSGLTDSLYVSKYLTITGGTGAGQVKLITANTTTTIFIEGTFDVIPDGTSTFNIKDREGQIYASNGVESIIINATTFINGNTTYNKKFHYMDVAHNRIFGGRYDEDIIWFSDLGTTNFGRDNFIPLDPDGDKITGIIANKDAVVIYKQHSRFRLIGSTPEFFELVKSDSDKGAIAPKSICTGNNLMFFVSEEGIEMYNSLENSTLEEGLPISTTINSLIQNQRLSDRINSVGCVIGNKMLMSIGTKTFVYDIEQSAKKGFPMWSVYDLSFNNAKKLQGQMYHSKNGITYKFNKDEANPINKNISIKSRRYDLKDPSRDKNMFKLRLLFEKPTGSTVLNISLKYDGNTTISFGSFDIYTNPEIILFSNRIARDVEVNITSTVNQYFEFVMGEISYEFLTKI